MGKTTTTYHVGCSLAYYHNKKVLIVDIDPRSNLTFLCVDYDSWKRFKQNNGTISTMYQLFLEGKAFHTSRYIWQNPMGSRFTKISYLDLIPGDLDLFAEDLGGMSPVSIISQNPFKALRIQAEHTFKRWKFLMQAFSQVENKYDYISLDCPPNLYLMIKNALFASDWYVVTVIPE